MSNEIVEKLQKAYDELLKIVMATRKEMEEELEENGYSVIEELGEFTVFTYKEEFYLRKKDGSTWIAGTTDDGSWGIGPWVGHWTGRYIIKTRNQINLLETVEEVEDIDSI